MATHWKSTLLFEQTEHFLGVGLANLQLKFVLSLSFTDCKIMTLRSHSKQLNRQLAEA